MPARNLLDWISLNLLPGLGPIRLQRALERFGDPGHIAFRLSLQELGAVAGLDRPASEPDDHNPGHSSGLDQGYNCSYTLVMKTAISIPDELFEAAEMAARRLGLSRSQLYAKAVAEYLAQKGTEGVTEQLDAVYAERKSELDAVLQRMQFASVAEEDW